MSEESNPGVSKDKRRTPASARVANFVLREPEFIPPLNKVTSVAVFAFTEAGELVVTVEKRGPDLPGGHMEVDEQTFEATARRESHEEAGIELGVLRFLCAIESDFYGTLPDELTYMVIMTGKVTKFGAEPSDATRVVLSTEEFKKQHTALRKELIDRLVDAAVSAVFGSTIAAKDEPGV